MTNRALERDFALRSPLSRRAPADIGDEEKLQELQDEMDKRRRLYPGFVERQTMTADQARHHIAVWQALVDDHLRRQAIIGLQRQGQPTRLVNDPPWRGDWDGRVRELRRELALRRTGYPKWIANPTNPLTEGEARRKLECLDAIHYDYWVHLAWFTAPDAAAHPLDAAHLATLSAADYLAHPLKRADMAALRDFAWWQRGYQPLDRAPVDGRAVELAGMVRDASTAHWAGYWAQGEHRPGRPIDFHPHYFREQETAA